MPFTVLHVCLGNICRSPMAERLLARNTDPGVVRSISCGTGSWHIGEFMDSHAAAQLHQRGADTSGYAAQQLSGELIEEADLILTAGSQHRERVLWIDPSAESRTFLLKEFGRIARTLPRDLSLRELVVAADKARDTVRYADELADPWGMGGRMFGTVADEIEEALDPLVART